MLMSMAANRVVELCDQSAAVIRADLARIESGELRFVAANDDDITEEQAAHLRANLSRLQEIIDGCGCHCA